MAWQHISPEATLKGPMQWMVQNDSEEDRNASSECEEDEGTDCEDGDSATDW